MCSHVFVFFFFLSCLMLSELWICGLLHFINLGKLLDISSNISCVPFSSFSTPGVSNTHVRQFDIVHISCLYSSLKKKSPLLLSLFFNLDSFYWLNFNLLILLSCANSTNEPINHIFCLAYQGFLLAFPFDFFICFCLSAEIPQLCICISS